MDDHLPGLRVLVMGLGRFAGGVGVCKFLTARGAHVTVTDKASPDDLTESVAQLTDLPITFHLGGHHEQDFLDADLIVVTPAAPKHSQWVRFAIEHGKPLTSEMNLFMERCPARTVGVTGSNGKSSTTAMIHHIAAAAQTAGQLTGNVYLGGNIGASLLPCVDEITAQDTVVLELSSFQLHDLAALKRSVNVAVVTNIAPNHLDWHETMQAYIAAKQNILRFQSKDAHAILNAADPELLQWPPLTKGTVHWFGKDETAPIKLAVPGRHNQANAQAALKTARVLGIDDTFARTALAGFKGLPHRLELVGEIAGVRYYNDSIATTPESVIAAVDAFTEPKVLILGGYDKQISFTALAQHLTSPDRNVKTVVLLGQVREKLDDALQTAQQQSSVETPAIIRAENFDQAVALARRQAAAGDVVLLSPACASYDMFANFQQRGDRFRELVAAM